MAKKITLHYLSDDRKATRCGLPYTPSSEIAQLAKIKQPKPLGRKNYGSIGHLPNSRIGPGDHHVHAGQGLICTQKVRDRHDRVIVTEKLDGSNVGVVLLGGQIIALGRSGYLAETSKFEMHQLFADWVRQNEGRFRSLLGEGERCVGEWLAQAHGTRYNLPHEPFVIFDIMRGSDRLPWGEVVGRCTDFILPHEIHTGAISVEDAMAKLGQGFHGAIDEVEGAVWRVERNGEFDFMAKFVRPDKQDGKYLPEISMQPEIWNWRPHGR